MTVFTVFLTLFRMGACFPFPITMPYPFFFPPRPPYTPWRTCLLRICRNNGIACIVGIISVIRYRIGRWILIKIYDVGSNRSLTCTASSADTHVYGDILFRRRCMPFHPHKLLSVLRIIHIVYRVVPSKDTKRYTYRMVGIALPSTYGDGCYHIRVYPVLIICRNHFRCYHLIKPYNTKS